MDNNTRWDKIKRNKYSWITAIILHLLAVFFIINSKGCVEIQIPPKFTLEEVVMDFTLPPDPTEMGGGDEGASKPNKTPEPPKGKEETVQEESPVESSSGPTETESEEPKLNTSDLFGQGNSNQGTGEGGPKLAALVKPTHIGRLKEKREKRNKKSPRLEGEGMGLLLRSPAARQSPPRLRLPPAALGKPLIPPKE